MSSWAKEASDQECPEKDIPDVHKGGTHKVLQSNLQAGSLHYRGNMSATKQASEDLQAPSKSKDFHPAEYGIVGRGTRVAIWLD